MFHSVGYFSFMYCTQSQQKVLWILIVGIYFTTLAPCCRAGEWHPWCKQSFLFYQRVPFHTTTSKLYSGWPHLARNLGSKPAVVTEPRSGQPEHSLGVIRGVEWQLLSGTVSLVHLEDRSGHAPDLPRRLGYREGCSRACKAPKQLLQALFWFSKEFGALFYWKNGFFLNSPLDLQYTSIPNSSFSVIGETKPHFFVNAVPEWLLFFVHVYPEQLRSAWGIHQKND